MQTAPTQPHPVPADETERLRDLASYDVCGTAPEADYDHVARLAADLFDVPIALVNLVGRDDVWEYCSTTTAGYGDPLTRDPGAVVIDVAEALLSAPAAREIYGVVILDGQVDQPATAGLRQRLRNARLGRDAGDAGDVPAGDVPAAAEARGPARDQRPIAHSFVYSPSEATFGCAACGYELGSTDANYKDQCRTVERPIREIGAEFAGTEETISAKMVFRDYFCPGCGLRLDTEISRIGDPALRDITLLPVSSD